MLEEKSPEVAAEASDEVVVDLFPLTASAIVEMRSARVASARKPTAAFNLVLSWGLESEAGGHIVNGATVV